MKKKILFISFILSIANGYTQNNLVFNGSFEQVNGCPIVNNVIMESYLNHVSNPGNYSPDYYNSCYFGGPFSGGFTTPDNVFGYQFPKSGNAYIGIGLWEKNTFGAEYIQIKLKDSLKLEHHYVFTCYLSRAEKQRYATSEFGIYFTNDSVSMPNIGYLPFMPQLENPATNFLTDTSAWMPFTGTYFAQGGEKYVILGNFHDSAQSIDTLYQYYGGAGYHNGAYYYIDDVSLIDLDSLVAVEEIGSWNDEFSLIPNPASSTITVNYGGNYKSIIIQEINGKIVLTKPLNTNTKAETFNVSDLANGIYIVQLINDAKISRVKLIINK